MARAKVGAQFAQQDAIVDELRAARQAADELGVDTIWLWDHFFPFYGRSDANHFEASPTRCSAPWPSTPPARSSERW